MVVQRLMLLVVSLLAFTGCDLLNFGQDQVDRTLWPLQVAIEQYMEHRVKVPPPHPTPVATADTGHETPAATEAGHETPATTDEHSVEGTEAETTPEPEAVTDDPHPVDENTEAPSTPEPVAEETSHTPVAGEPHGISAESHGDDEEQPEPVAVVVAAVVDSHYLRQVGEEDEEQAAAQVGDAQRRERVVRREIHNALVANNLMQALPSDEANEELARQSIVDNNSAALSKELCATIGSALGAEVIICVLIDRDGAEVNVAAQVTATGEMIYQDALVDWEPAVKAIEQAPAE